MGGTPRVVPTTKEGRSCCGTPTGTRMGAARVGGRRHTHVTRQRQVKSTICLVHPGHAGGSLAEQRPSMWAAWPHVNHSQSHTDRGRFQRPKAGSNDAIRRGSRACHMHEHLQVGYAGLCTSGPCCCPDDGCFACCVHSRKCAVLCCTAAGCAARAMKPLSRPQPVWGCGRTAPP